MNRMALFRSLVVGAVVVVGWFGFSLATHAQSNPCTAPAACMDTTDWSGAQVSANCTLPLLQCPGMQDGVYCCRPLPQNEAPADPQSNVQGAAAAQTGGAAITSAGGNCSYNGVKDPFCGISVAGLIGRIVQFLLGAAGALFLAMFVYGGAVWLTAGSSDRHEQAQKTLLNAAAGILVVILSYTMVSLLIRFAGGLGVGQTDTRAVTSENDTFSESGGGTGEARQSGGLPSSAAGGAAGSCRTEAVQSSCGSLVERVLEAGIYRAAVSTAGCAQVATEFCRNIRSADSCAAACPAVCDGIRNVRESDIPVPVPDGALDRLRAIDCAAECPALCAAAFR